MYEQRRGFWAAYAIAGIVAAGTLAAFVGLGAFRQPVRVVKRTLPAPPITSVADAQAHINGQPIGADAGLPDGCSGVYVDGGAVIFCRG